MVGRVPLQAGGAVEHLTAHRVPTGRLTACRLRADNHAQRSHCPISVVRGVRSSCATSALKPSSWT